MTIDEARVLYKDLAYLNHEEFMESYNKVKEQTENVSEALANIVIDRVNSFEGIDKEGNTLFSWSVSKNDD